MDDQLLLYTGLDNLPFDIEARIKERYDTTEYESLGAIARNLEYEYGSCTIAPSQAELTASYSLIEGYLFALCQAGVVPDNFMDLFDKTKEKDPKLDK